MKNKMIMPILAISLVIVGVIIGLVGSSHLEDRKIKDSNENAQKDKENRYLTIINDTEQIINEVHIIVGEGTEIESSYQKNPDEISFSVKIPKEFEEYDEFTVIVIDRYGLKYEKVVSDVPIEGRVEVKITEDDYVEQKGDFKKKIDKWFNND